MLLVGEKVKLGLEESFIMTIKSGIVLPRPRSKSDYCGEQMCGKRQF